MTAVRVLHVEDESDIREIVEIVLGLNPDFVLRSCSSGHEALAAAVDWPPDLILLDVMMPVMDGPATLARLRGNAQTAKIPVVFMTACAQSRELDRFRSLGVVGVIPKPFDPMTLAASVRAYIPPADGGLGAVQNIFLRRLNEDATTLVEHRSALISSKAVGGTLTALRGIAHRLAGAGGIFGFSEISEAAAALEDAIIAELAGSPSDKAISSTLDRLLTCVETSRVHQISHSRLDA